jgi:hypothetical protein
MALVFDAGGLIALERGERRVGALLAEAARVGVESKTSSACVAQAWRNPARQARLTRALSGMLEQPLDAPAARECGLLLARAQRSDIADAALVLMSEHSDTVLTSDAQDIEHLLAAANKRALVLAV